MPNRSKRCWREGPALNANAVFEVFDAALIVSMPVAEKSVSAAKANFNRAKDITSAMTITKKYFARAQNLRRR